MLEMRLLYTYSHEYAPGLTQIITDIKLKFEVKGL